MPTLTAAQRKEYWIFVPFHFIFAMVATIIDGGLGFSMAPLPYGYITVLYLLAMLVPSIAVAVRRLHDVGKSGWFYFIGLIPLIGGIWPLMLFIKEGDRGDNEYGPDPENERMPGMS